MIDIRIAIDMSLRPVPEDICEHNFRVSFLQDYRIDRIIMIILKIL